MRLFILSVELVGSFVYTVESDKILKYLTQFFFIKGSTNNTDDRLDVDKELFVWSIITGRRDVNLLFWARGKNKICK